MWNQLLPSKGKLVIPMRSCEDAVFFHVVRLHAQVARKYSSLATTFSSKSKQSLRIWPSPAPEMCAP